MEVAQPRDVTNVKALGSSMVQAGQGMSDRQEQLSGAALKPFPHQRTLNPSLGAPALVGIMTSPCRNPTAGCGELPAEILCAGRLGTAVTSDRTALGAVLGVQQAWELAVCVPGSLC